MIEQTLFFGPYGAGASIADLSPETVKRVAKKRAAREGRAWPKQNGPKRKPGRQRKAAKDRRRSDALVRQLYRIRGMINEFGAVAVSIHDGAVRASSDPDKYRGDLVGVYDRRSKLKDLEADIRTALAGK